MFKGPSIFNNRSVVPPYKFPCVKTLSPGANALNISVEIAAIPELHKKPKASIDDILSFLKKRAIQKGKKITKYGWIPDPLDNYLID